MKPRSSATMKTMFLAAAEVALAAAEVELEAAEIELAAAATPARPRNATDIAAGRAAFTAQELCSNHTSTRCACVRSLAASPRACPHDVGGLPSLAHASLPKDKPLLPWELEAHALFAVPRQGRDFPHRRVSPRDRVDARSVAARVVVLREILVGDCDVAARKRYCAARRARGRNLRRRRASPRPTRAKIRRRRFASSCDGARTRARAGARRTCGRRATFTARPVWSSGMCGSFADPSLLAFGVAAPSAGCTAYDSAGRAVARVRRFRRHARRRRLRELAAGGVRAGHRAGGPLFDHRGGRGRPSPPLPPTTTTPPLARRARAGCGRRRRRAAAGHGAARGAGAGSPSGAAS